MMKRRSPPLDSRKQFQISANRQNNFNFLRVLFAALVILAHSFELVDGDRSRELLSKIFGTISFGEFAVDGFFLVSGFLIVQSWVMNPKPYEFLLKRVLRIYPAFIAASLICGFVVGPLVSESRNYLSEFEIWRFARGILLLREPIIPSVFAGSYYPVVNGPMWTIFLEFSCYLCVLAFGILGLLRQRSAWLIATASIIAAFLYQKLGYQFIIDGQIIYSGKHFLRLGMFFFCGGTFFILRQEFDAISSWISRMLGVALLIVLFDPVYAEIALALAGGYLLFHFSFARFSLIVPFQTLPDVSYGLYLYGWPISKLLIWYVPDLSPGVVFIATLSGGILAGLLSWYVIEKPFMSLRRRRQPSQMRPIVFHDQR